MKLNEISDLDGARKARVRVGRGAGSGKGKTCGRGVKGQKARSGVAIKGFEGGQMPIYRRLPKRGFHNPFRLDFAVVNIDRIQAAIDSGKLDVSADITSESLKEIGIAGKSRHGVRVLGHGGISSAVKLNVEGASAGAVAAIEAAGGSVVRRIAPRSSRPDRS